MWLDFLRSFLLLNEISTRQHHPLLLYSRDVSRCTRQLLLQACKNSRADTLRRYHLAYPPYRSITSGYPHFCLISLLVRACDHAPHQSPVLTSFDGLIWTLQCCRFILSHFSQPLRIPSGFLPFKPVIRFSSFSSPPVRH